MMNLVVGLGLLLAAAAPARAAATERPASVSSDDTQLRRLVRPAPARGARLSWGQDDRRLRSGALKRAGRVALRESFVRAEAAYIPKSGAAGNYRLITEFGVETPVSKSGLGFKAAWTDKRDSRPGLLEVRDEKLWSAALSLRFGR